VPNPITGQLWFDTSTNNLNSYNGTNWFKVGSNISGNVDIAGNLTVGGGGNVEIKYYALDSDATANQEASRMTLLLAPKWDASVTLSVEYQYHPRSIVDTDGDEEQPWLGTNYDSALLNATLVEAARFMKAEPDIIQGYDQQFIMSLQPLVDTVTTRLKSDSFRPTSAPARPLTVPAPAQPPQREG